MINTLLILFAVILVVYLYSNTTKNNEKFTAYISPKARHIYRKSRDLFDTRDVSYTEYKKVITQSDPVLYSDIRQLWKSGKLNPVNVQRVI